MVHYRKYGQGRLTAGKNHHFCSSRKTDGDPAEAVRDNEKGLRQSGKDDARNERYLVLVLIVFTLLLLVPLPALGGRDGDKPARHIKTAVCPRERCVGCQFGTGGGFYL